MGKLIQISPPPDFVIGTEKSVLWPSKYIKICFRPRWGAHDAFPNPLVGWRGKPGDLVVQLPIIVAASTQADTRRSSAAEASSVRTKRMCGCMRQLINTRTGTSVMQLAEPPAQHLTRVATCHTLILQMPEPLPVSSVFHRRERFPRMILFN